MKTPTKYTVQDEAPSMVSESIGVANARDTMYQTYPLHVDDAPMPCAYSDEEFKDELVLSEASGFVSNEEFKRSCFEKWGVAL